VTLLYGSKFQPTGDILALMGVVLIFMSVNILLGKFLIATERQNWWTVTMALAVVATIPMDYVLIPWCQRTFGNGGLGGAITYLITEIAMTVVALRLMPKGLLVKADLWRAARVVLAGGLMAASVWLFRDLPLLVQIGVGIGVYVPTAALLRAVPMDELVLLSNMAGSFARQVRARWLSRPA
jgi:O-antigen/teichoic acid export membrane protein